MIVMSESQCRLMPKPRFVGTGPRRSSGPPVSVGQPPGADFAEPALQARPALAAVGAAVDLPEGRGGIDQLRVRRVGGQKIRRAFDLTGQPCILPVDPVIAAAEQAAGRAGGPSPLVMNMTPVPSGRSAMERVYCHAESIGRIVQLAPSSLLTCRPAFVVAKRTRLPLCTTAKP